MIRAHRRVAECCIRTRTRVITRVRLTDITVCRYHRDQRRGTFWRSADARHDSMPRRRLLETMSQTTRSWSRAGAGWDCVERAELYSAVWGVEATKSLVGPILNGNRQAINLHNLMFNWCLNSALRLPPFASLPRFQTLEGTSEFWTSGVLPVSVSRAFLLGLGPQKPSFWKWPWALAWEIQARPDQTRLDYIRLD